MKMKMKMPKLAGLFILIFAVIAIGIIYTNKSGKTTQQNISEAYKPGETSLSSREGLSVVHSDVLTTTNFKDLAKYSEVIVIGTVVEKRKESRNLARNPQNIQEAAKDRIVASQEYIFKIDKWLKGSGEQTITIVYPDYTEIINNGSQNNEDVSDGNLPLSPGDRYALFLKKGTEGTYFGPLEPWQFMISGDGKLNLRSNVQNLDKVFNMNNSTEDNLSKQIK